MPDRSDAGVTPTIRSVFLCTKATPWKPGIPGRVRHADARQVGDQRNGSFGGDLVEMRCDACGTSWTTELPQ